MTAYKATIELPDGTVSERVVRVQNEKQAARYLALEVLEAGLLSQRDIIGRKIKVTPSLSEEYVATNCETVHIVVQVTPDDIIFDTDRQ